MMIRRNITAAVFTVLIAIRPAGALDPNMRITQYAHAAWKIQDGSFSGAPHAIAQTSDGYLWFGTDAGLVKFDGVRFAPWEPPQGKRLPSSTIYSLLGGRDGTLWIGSAGGLASWNDNQFVDFSNMRGRINAILEDRTGQVWAARSRPREPTGGLCRVAGQELRCLGNSNGMALDFGSPLVQDSADNLWIGSSNELLRWKNDSWDAYFREQLRPYAGLGGVEALAVGENGTLWVGFTKKGLGLQQIVQGVARPAILLGLDTANLQVSTLFVDRDKTLWIGTVDDGLYRLHGTFVDHFRSEDGLSGNGIQSFYEDREGDLWVLSTKGVDVFRTNRVATVSLREGLSADYVSSVTASRDGSIWIGNQEALDVIRGDGISSIRAQSGLPGHRVTSLYEDHAGKLFVGVDRLLTIYEQGQFHAIEGPDGKEVGPIISITEDIDQNIWAINAIKRSLLRIKDRRIQEEFTASQIPYARVIAADPRGGIWLGLVNGDLARLRTGKAEIIPLMQESPKRPINSLLVDPDSSVWVATNSGLFRWKEGKLNSLTVTNGLPCQDVMAGVRDNENTLWLYAKCGLIAVRNSELDAWSKQRGDKVQTRVFDVFDGALPASSTFQPQVSRSPDGRLWFVNDSVLQVVDPKNLPKNRIPPPVHIEKVVANRNTYSASANLSLPPLQRDLEFDYTALSFVVPQKVRFRYMLEGRDREWQEAGTRRQVFYTDLRPGRYRFRVIASNNDGLWNEEGAALDFSIAPAWYQTYAFLFFSFAAAAVVALALYRWRIRQLAGAINARFEERVAERTRIARELHDTFLQTIQGSKLVVDDALKSSADDGLRVRRAMEQLSQWLEQAMHESRAALNSLRASTTQNNDLAQTLKQATADAPPAMEVSFKVIGEAKAIHPIVRDEVYRIGYEAIRNACAHSKASRLEVSLTYTHDLTLRVHDNGSGIDPVIAQHGREGHFGLRGMLERAARIDSKLAIFSPPNSGTEVSLVVPGAIVFLTRRKM